MARRKTNEEFLEDVFKKEGTEFTFLEEYKNSATKLKVRHNVCGFISTAVPNDFLVHGGRCRKCSNKFSPTNNEFKTRVKGLVGGEYVFLEEYINTNTPLKVRHEGCGKEYKVRPADFYRGNRCKECRQKEMNKLRTKTTEYYKNKVKEIVGTEFEVVSEYAKAKEPIDILHKTCGKTFTTTPDAFIKRYSCPNCRITRGERDVKNVLESMGVEYEMEKSIGGVLRADFYLPKYQAYIEYDGIQHFEEVEFWGGVEKLEETIKRDSIKNHYWRFLGFPYLRIPYWEKHNIHKIVSRFIEDIQCEVSI